MFQLGRILFAVGFALLGAFKIGWHSFAEESPLPKWLPWHDMITVMSGIILLASAIALLIPRAAKPAALVLAGYMLLQLLVLWVPRVAAHPLVEVIYEQVSETLIFLAGAWTIFSLLPGATPVRFANVRAGQLLFALATPAIGLSHVLCMNLTVPLIPDWIPFHVPLAWFTGACWIAAGIGIVLRVGLAATLVSVMVSLFTLLVWVPKVIAAPTDASNWSEFCVSMIISGAAWTVAASFGDEAFGLRPSRARQ